MTSSLGVEVTPGPLPRPVSVGPLSGRADGRRSARHAGRRSVTSSARCSATASGRACCTTRPGRRWTTASWPTLLARGAEVSRRVTDALRRGGAQRSFVPDERVRARARPGQPQDAGPAGRRAPGRGPAPAVETRSDGEVAWVDGTRRNVRLRLSPIDVGPVLVGDALGRGHLGPDERHHPAPHRRAGRAEAVPDRRAQRRKPLRLPLPRAALRGAPPAGPPRRRSRGGPARGAGAADRGGRRAHAGPLHEPAGHRGGGRGTGARAALHGAAPGRSAQEPACSRSSPPTRPRASSPPWASGRAWTSRAGPSRWSPSTGCPSPVPTTRCCRPGADRAGGGAFSLVDLPRAATMLAQGAGRLIRNAGGPRRRRRARPATGDGVLQGRAAPDPAAHAAVRRHAGGGVVPATGAGGRARVGRRQ